MKACDYINHVPVVLRLTIYFSTKNEVTVSARFPHLDLHIVLPSKKIASNWKRYADDYITPI